MSSRLTFFWGFVIILCYFVTERIPVWICRGTIQFDPHPNSTNNSVHNWGTEFGRALRREKPSSGVRRPLKYLGLMNILFTVSDRRRTSERERARYIQTRSISWLTGDRVNETAVLYWVLSTIRSFHSIGDVCGPIYYVHAPSHTNTHTHTRTGSYTRTRTWEREDRRKQERGRERGMFLSFRFWVSGDSKHLHRYLPSIYVNRRLDSLTCPTNWTVQVIYPLSTVVCRGPTSQWLLFEIIRWSVYRLGNTGTTTYVHACVCCARA